ncbi:abnormal spindle-like microcephaly-associated protein homolog [Hippocampus zosterae]|uniref:abnormal spindle-like microcephaly-associated protein homolog n=1 Tax=Hippocampus zosterae TaxID=109293 RepID=UPI00223C93EF|nr:abnormal spindle-like microcephaly-associated protein homolog [Hippocampus zosterae]
MSESVALPGARGSFVEFSPTRNRDTDKENDVAVLSLHLFSKATFVSFGTVKIGTSKSTALRIENPTEFAEAVLTVDKIPSSKGFSVDNNTFTIRPLGSYTLTLTWTPTEEGGIRELIVFNANGIVKHQAILLGKAEAPQKKKRRLWDAIKKKRAVEKGSPYRGKWSALPTKMAANKTLHVTWKQQYEPRSPLASLNDGKTGRDKSTGEHGLLEGYSLKSKPQKPFNAVRKQWSLASQENHSSLVSDTSEKEMKAGSGSLAGKLENKDPAKILKALSPIGTPERLQKIMPHIQPVGCTAAVTSPTCPAVSLNDALALIDSGFALVNRSTKDSSTSSDFSDSLEFKSEDPERFKAHPDSPEESTEPRLTFFVTKKVGGPKAENPERPKILSFNCETVIKSKAPVTNCQSGQRIKKSRRRLMEKTLELSEGSSQCESGPGTPHLPVIEPDTRTTGSLGGDSQTVQEFNGRPTARLRDAQLPIGPDGSSPPTRPHLSFSSPPHNVAPVTFTISSPLPLDQSSPLHSSNTSHPQPEPSPETDVLPRAVSAQEDVSPVRSLTKSRKRKSEEYLRGATKKDGGGKSEQVKKSKTVAWKSQPVKSTQERRKSQRRSIKSKGSPHAMTTSVKTLTSSVSTQTQPASAKLPLRGAHARRSLGAEHGKCVKMAPVAMSKLIFVKTTRTAIPRHPLPFAAKNMFYDERWIEKQERAFTWWLNYVLTPDDFKVNTESTKVNAAPLAMGCSDKFHVPKAPTKEEMSFSTYTARRKLNRLRRAACQLFTSETMVKAIKRLELEVEAKRLLIRKDRHLWKDIGERQKVLNWLLSYNPLWLRIGLETIFGEMISLESNSDAVGLAMFILQRLLWNPDIAAEFRHSKVPHLYKDGHEEALSSFTLKKLLLLVCFLDKAKASRLIEHDPCLFCVDAEFKTSKDLLLAFSRDFLSGEGILPRHLGFLGLPVSHVQTPLDEFSYAVVNLAVDLKCGIRLVRVMELLIKQWGLSAKLRLPAISRLQKIHNVDIAMQVLKIRGVDLKDEHGSVIDSRDIVDGHREKTLSLLWKIIFSFQVEVILNEGQLREEILFLRRTLRSKRTLASVRAGRGLEPSALKTKAPYEHRSAKVVLLMEWARAVCDFYNLTLENFTVTFSDGRVLCYLIHHYHPSLISEESLRHSTTQTVDCSSRGRLELNCSAIDSDCSFDDAPESPNGPESPSAEFKKLLENEKSNFGLVNAAVAFLGGVPSMINPADMSNTIPNEQVVMCYLSFLCARLLDLRNETRAARVIQGAWRTYRIKKDLQVYKERNAAAAKIQRAVKRFLQRRRARNQNAASVIIQSAWRGFVIRKRLRLEKEAQLRGIRNRAATIIQAQWRMFSARRYYQRVRSTAVVVQARWRMKRAASAFVKIRRATAVLQRYSRAWIHGRKVRTRYLRLKAAAVTMQRGYRLWKIQKTQRENRAARVIQSAYKKWHVERMAERTAAAVKIQSFYRRQRCLRQYRKIQRSALLIQAHCRGLIQRSRFQKRTRQHQSAVVIQSAFRGHRVRKQALRIKRAAVVIQRWYRASARRAAERQRFVEMRRAARTVQLAYRKKRNRDSLKRRHRAATVIQAAFRKFACRWRYLALRNATVVIQQKLRAAILARKTKEEYGALRKAALTIQAYWRGRADRMRIKKYHRSATLIRAHYRRRKAQAEFRSKKAAAVVIQRRYRAHVAAKKTREAFLRKKAACATIAAGFRGMKVRADLQKKHKAATVIQSALRMYSARKRYRLLQSATVIIQCRYRARLCCRAERRKYEEQKKAALKIQAVYRGWRGREEFKKRIQAISFIQAAFRTHRVRKAYLATKCAAVILQARYRAKIRMAEQLKMYRRTKSAAVTIQAAYRGYRARRNFAQMRRVASSIHRRFRMIQERNRFLALKTATLALQRRYRALLLTREVRRQYLSRRRAAVCLQAAFRGMRARRLVKQKHRAASTIQRAFRARREHKKYMALKSSVLAVQRRYRATVAAKAQMRRYQTMRKSSIVIQSACRGLHVRKDVARWHRAATLIQSKFRKHREEVRFRSARLSAIVIQRHYRAFALQKRDRGYYLKVRSSAVVLQAAFRGRLARGRIGQMHRAATVIQANFKRHKQRLLFRKRRRAALVLQQRFRAMRERNSEMKRYREVRNAAICLQAAFRGMESRKSIRQKHRAATVIQAAFRSRRQKVQFQATRLSVITIQRCYRAYVLQKKERDYFLKIRTSVICLQSFFRGCSERRRIAKMHRAATVIQANFKRHRQQLRFRKQLWAARVLQQRFRAASQRNVEVKRYREVRNAVICLQAAFRGMKSRQSIRQKHRAATVIQSAFRCRRERVGFQAKRLAAIVIQRGYRAHVLQEKERDYFLRVRSSIICLQAVYRGRLERRRIAEMHRAATVIQANFKRRNQQSTFKKQLWAICVLQRRFRSQRQKRLEVKRYNKVRNAAICLQAAFRAMKSRQSIRQKHCAATVIQSAFRAHRQLKRYQNMKSSALTVQRRFRATAAAKSQRKHFLEMRRAAVIFQAAYRGRQTRKHIARLHRAATAIQSAYRRRVELVKFETNCASVLLIQKYYRAFIRQRRERSKFLKLKRATVVLQAAYRAYRVRRDIRQQSRAATLIQSSWRCSVQRRLFLKSRAAAVKLQEWVRAMRLGKEERENYLRTRRAAIALQTHYRAWIVRKRELDAANARRRLHFAAAVYHHLSAIKIQRALRAHRALESAKRRIHSVVVIQNLVRARFQRRRYLAQRRKIVTVQRAVRRWLVRRHNSASVIQCAARRFLLIRHQKKVERGIVKIQALWRGHVSRRLNDNSKVIKLRRRLHEVSAGAREEDKLQNKTSSALDCILRYRHFSSLLEALKNLEAATRLSPVCCEHLVESGATGVIFTLIRSCNRSVPCMDVITYSVQILLNLSKYHKTIEAVYLVENSVETLVSLIQTYREKAGGKVADKGASIFTKACFLLVLLLQDKSHAVEAMNCPKVLERVTSIYRLTVRKYKMDAERNVAKQKMNAPINGSFYIPATPRKCQPVPRFAPDWVLRKDNLPNIVDPLKAIRMLANTLSIVM